MALNIIKNYLKNNRCYQKAQKRKQIGIQLHTIGTGQGTAKSVADYWNQYAIAACVTYIVDCDTPGKVLQCLPEDYYSWADSGYGNKNLITFEICESDYIKYTGGANYKILDAAKFKADIMRGYNTAVELCADICKRYGWNPQAKLPSGLYLISSHDEGRRAGLSSAHVDPTHIWDRFGLTMDGFRKDVASAMAGTVIAQPETAKLYRVRKTWTDVASQLNAYEVLENAKNGCLPGYTVYDENGVAVYTNAAVVSVGLQAADLQGLSEVDKIAKIAPLYQDCMRKTGMLASVGLAQFALECGYGTTDLARFANNLHGMKCSLSGNTWDGSVWDGISKYGKKSPEVYNGVTKMVYSEFRKYPCCEDSIADRAAYFIGAKNGDKLRYPGIAGITDYVEQIRLIKAGNYATDPEYVDKLCSIVERFNLQQYDEGIERPADVGKPSVNTDTSEPWYRVRKTWADARSQKGAFHDLEKAKICAKQNQGYSVYDEAGNKVYPVQETSGIDQNAPTTEQETENGILAQCAKFQAQLATDIAAGRSWAYHNPAKYLEEQWKNAVRKEKRACNCALLARWALKEAGLIPQTTGIFYGKKGGTISWGSGAKAEVGKTCDIIKIGNKTVKQLIASGQLQPGDIVTYVDIQHTNIYAGGGKWYDAGHAYCSGSGEGAKYKSWYGDQVYGAQKVGYIIRKKPGTEVQNQSDKRSYTVQAGGFTKKANADKLTQQLIRKGFAAIVKKSGGMYKVQCGVFEKRTNAEKLVAQLKKAGFEAIIK